MNLQKVLTQERSRIKLGLALLVTIMFFFAAFRPYHMAFYSLNTLIGVLTAYFIITLAVLTLGFVVYPRLFSKSFQGMMISKKGRMLWASAVALVLGLSFFSFKVIFGFYELTLQNIATGLLAFGAFLALPMGALAWLDQSPPKKATAQAVLLSIGEKWGEVELSELLYIYSDKNYVVWVCDASHEVREFRVRETLTSVADRLKDYPEIVLCHRAYLVNTGHVASVTKTGATYQLTLKDGKESIPLSKRSLHLFRQF